MRSKKKIPAAVLSFALLLFGCISNTSGVSTAGDDDALEKTLLSAMAKSANDFVGKWTIKEICRAHTTDPSDPSYVGLDGYEITIIDEHTYGFKASTEFGSPEWDKLELGYFRSSKIERPTGKFHCSPTVPFADFLYGTVKLHGKTHNVKIFLLEDSETHDGNTAPMISYQHAAGEAHDGWMH